MKRALVIAIEGNSPHFDAAYHALIHAIEQAIRKLSSTNQFPQGKVLEIPPEQVEIVESMIRAYKKYNNKEEK